MRKKWVKQDKLSDVAPDQDEILDYLDGLQPRTSAVIGQFFGARSSAVRPVLDELEKSGKVKTVVVMQERRFFVPKAVPEGVGRYVPQFRELKGYDLGINMRLAESARNPVTGVV